MKKFIYVFTLLIIFINSTFAASTYTKKDITTISTDKFIIKSTLEYPKIKGCNEYSTVILLHSLGYTSEWWNGLQQILLNEGYAVLSIDIRGHGKSIYNKKLVKTSWKNMTNTAFAKCPNDVINIINQIQKELPKISFFNNWAIVGSDLGANVGILAAEQYKNHPKTIILISPTISIKGLFLPVKIANLEKTDFLAIYSDTDYSSQNAKQYLNKFTKNTFASYVSSTQKNGMLLLKNDENINKIILSWIKEYL